MPMKDKALQEILSELQSGALGQALVLTQNFLLMHQTVYYDMFNAINDDYRLMLDYYCKGYPDEQRGEVYRQLVRRLYVLVANIDWDIQVADSPYLNSLRKQVQQAGYDWSLPTVRRELEEHVSAVALLEFEQEHVRQQKSIDLHQRHQQYMNLLFCRILTAGQWKESEGQAFAELLLSPTISLIDQQLLVSAVMLSCMQMFDYEKFHALLTIYCQHADEVVRQRALVGWALAADSSLSAIYPSLEDEVNAVCRDERCRQEFTELQMQLLYCLEAEKDTQVIQQEIMPELMKGNNLSMTSHGLVEMDEDRLEEILHPEAAEQNMERMEASMHRMVDMQKQGADIYFGGFSQMKRFPFFDQVSNWFMPYYADHPAISPILQNTRGKKFLNIITRVGAFCDSDKYSFVLGFNQVLGRIPDSMLKLIDDGEAVPTPVGGEISLEEQQQPAFMRRMYLQDVYRFYRVFPARSHFRNPFRKEQQKPEYIIFANPLFKKTDLVSNCLEIASFLMKRKLFVEAQSVINNYPPNENDVRYFLVTGHLNASLNNPVLACAAYREACRLQPDNEKALAGYARLLFRTEQYNEALLQFKTLLQRKPDHRGYCLNTAVCLLHTDGYDEALQLLYRLNYEYPDDLVVLRSLAWGETLSGKYEEALSRYGKIIEKAPEDLLNNGVCLWLSHDISGAVNLFRRYLSEEGGNRQQLLAFFMDDEHPTLTSRGITDVEILLMLDTVTGMA